MALALVAQTLVCADCEKSFVYSIEEQAFCAERGFRQPVCCPECRARRRAERNAEAIKAHEAATGAQSWQEGFGNFGGAVAVSNPPRRLTKLRGPRERGPRFVYPAVCTACGRDTEVPFPPRGGRPVFCRECFDARRGR
jgi:CxxC-x17-CxxC domain-containing protein